MLHVAIEEESHSSLAPNRARVQSLSFLDVIISLFLNLLLLPVMLTPLWGFFTVAPQEEALITLFGRLVKVCRHPGIYWFSWIGRKTIRISTATQTIDIKKTTVVDSNGNPVIVSGVVTFRIVDTIRAAFDVTGVNAFLEKQAVATLKKVCSKYPYESKDGHSLQREPEIVYRESVSALQKKGDTCGAQIISVELADLQYAPEIAQGMLVRQSATALLDARKTVVEGAVGIVTDAMKALASSGVKMTEREQARLASNLLAVICSDAKVQPVFSLSENVEAQEQNSNTQAELLKTLQSIRTMFSAKQGGV